MFEHLATGLALEAIIFANILIGIPFIVFAWYLGWAWPIEAFKNNFEKTKYLFSCSVLLNSVWIVLAFIPSRYDDQLRWILDSGIEFVAILIGFACLAISIYVE